MIDTCLVLFSVNLVFQVLILSLFLLQKRWNFDHSCQRNQESPWPRGLRFVREFRQKQKLDHALSARDPLVHQKI